MATVHCPNCGTLGIEGRPCGNCHRQIPISTRSATVTPPSQTIAPTPMTGNAPHRPERSFQAGQRRELSSLADDSASTIDIQQSANPPEPIPSAYPLEEQATQLVMNNEETVVYAPPMPSPAQAVEQGNGTNAPSPAATERGPKGSSRRSTNVTPQPLAKLRAEMQQLLTLITSNAAQRYFPGDEQKRAEVLLRWEHELKVALAYIDLLATQRIARQYDEQIRRSLTQALHQFDFRRAFEIKLIGRTGVGKSTLFCALLGEDIFPSGSGKPITGTRIKVRFADISNAQDGETMTVSLRDGTTKTFSRAHWQQAVKDYVLEPVGAMPNQVQQVRAVEFVLQSKERFFPPNCEFIDLPGGEAGEARHEAILTDELNQLDALIYVTGGSRILDINRDTANGSQPQAISQQVKEKISRDRRSDIAARMMFVVLTHWDIAQGNDRRNYEDSMEKLLAYLPENYRAYHQLGPDGNYFFYPVRAEDAFLATQGIQCKEHTRPLSAELQNRGETYRGRISSIYDQLKRSNPTLPPEFTAQKFDDISLEQHQAMLDESQLQTLIDDIQRFLTEQRYEVQLDAASGMLTDAIEQFIMYSCEQLRSYGIDISNRDTRKISLLRESYRTQRAQLRQKAIISRIDQMEQAWDDTLQQFMREIDPSQAINPAFAQALEDAFEHATRHVRRFIQSGQFNKTIDNEQINPSGANAPVTEKLSRSLKRYEFLAALRATLLTALEEELQKPSAAADVLAKTLLKHLERKERPGGPLFLPEVSFGAFDRNSSLQERYITLKQRYIEERAQDICRYVTSTLLMSEGYGLNETQGALPKLIAFIASNQDPLPTFFSRVHPYMAEALDEMQQKVRQDSTSIILHFFIREVRHLTQRDTLYRSNEYTEPERVRPEDGDFKKLVKDLRTEMVIRLSDPEFIKQLDAQLFTHDVEIDLWFSLITQANDLRDGIIPSPKATEENATLSQ